MKPPVKRPGVSGARSRGEECRRRNKPKRLCYLSPLVPRGTGKKNGSPAAARPSPHTLPTPPSFNLSFGSDINDELFSCVDKIDLDLVCSTPVGMVQSDRHATAAMNASFPFNNVSTSPLFDFSSSQLLRSDLKSLSCMRASSTTTPCLSSFMTTPAKDCQGHLKLSQWGIPDLVLEKYAQRGITSMYEWQAECLMQPGVLQGGNLVFSAPTSAGKTFVAELLALKCVLETKKKVVIILPFVSIAHEKANYLQSIFEPNGVKVGGFMGGHSPPGGFAAVDIAICTIEKANSLINRLLEDGNIAELGTVVVDELHMIGDSHRGYLLELLLTKLLYFCKKNSTGGQIRSDASVGETNAEGERERHPGTLIKSAAIQIIGMSATLPNLDTLSTWLEGQLYSTDYRPVPLREMVKIGPTLFDTNIEKIRDLRDSESTNDEEDILSLCEETVGGGHSVLIFCPTKQWCETLAGSIATAPFLHVDTALPAATSEGEKGKEGATNVDGKEKPSHIALNSAGLYGVLEQLRRTQVGLDGILEKTVPCGVAFHHAGLTFDEREIVEGAFRQGLIRVLVATSTLSSGVNLPARLVIVRTPFFQRSLLDVLVYKQMVGRAGRKGVDERGESVLICKPSERSKVTNLFQSAPKPVTSCLDESKRGQRGRGRDTSALRRALLEVVVSGTATSQREIETYVRCTLLFAEMSKKFSKSPAAKTTTSPNKDAATIARNLVKTTLQYLLTNEFIAVRTPLPDRHRDNPGDSAVLPSAGSTEHHATQLGAATVASALSPEEALLVFAELRKARRNFVLENELHIIYLVTPVYVQEQWPSIDWYRFLCLLERLPTDVRHVANTLGIQESFLASAVQGRIPERTDAQRERLRIHRRFFTALALHDLVHEAPIVYASRKYSASKGLLQTLQSAAGTFAGMVTVFCSRLGWKNMELLLSQFQSRLSFGVERELCDLVRISLINGFRARALYNAGFHSLSALATANPLGIEHCLRAAVPFKSSKAVPEEEEGEDRGGGGVQKRSSTWCAKLRRGMTEFEAAREIVHEAQKVLSDEMNVPLETWKLVQQSAPLKPAALSCSPTRKVGPNLKTDREKSKMVRKSPNVEDSSDAKRPCLINQPKLRDILLHVSETSNHLHVAESKAACPHNITPLTSSDQTSKTPNQRKSLSRKKLSGAHNTKVREPVSKPSASPIITSSGGLVSSSALHDPQGGTEQYQLPLIPPPLPSLAAAASEEQSISYSPILSPDSSAHLRRSPSPCLLHTPLPSEPSDPTSHPPSPPPSPLLTCDKVDHNADQSANADYPLTIPNSLPCSMDMSVSFSCNTFAMIDAACGGDGDGELESGAPQECMSCSLISGADQEEEEEEEKRKNSGVVVGVVESPAILGDSSAVNIITVDTNIAPPVFSSPSRTTLSSHDTPENNCRKQLESETQIPPDRSLTTATAPSITQSVPATAQTRLKDLSYACSSQFSLTQSGTCIIDVTTNAILFETFVSECLEQESFSFSIATAGLEQGGAIGSKIVQPKTVTGIPIPHKSEQVTGLAICWGDMDVYYLSLCQPSPGEGGRGEGGGGEGRGEGEGGGGEVVPLETRIKAVSTLFQSKHCREVIAYSVKKHVKTLATVFGIIPTVQSLDPQVADWMLNPDGKEKTIHKMVLHYLPDQPVLSEGEDHEEMPLSNLATHASEPHIQASAECLLASLLMSKMRPLLVDESLYTPFLEVEMPSLLVLAKMELNGIGFSREECDSLKQILQLRLSQVETEAYALARRSFSLTSPEDVAQVLFLELKLPTTSADQKQQQKTLGLNRRGRKRIQHLSTAKDVLEKLTPLHPLPGLVLEWRRVSSTVTKTVFPLFKDAVHHTLLNSVRVHPTCQIHTATGRVATSDPNLQMVPKEYDIGSKAGIATMLKFDVPTSTAGTTLLLTESQCLRDACEHGVEEADTEGVSKLPSCRSSISMRSVFVPFPGGVFLAADYAQLELRILAHMSGDAKLQRVLNSTGDVFKMIAGQWLGVPPSEVSPKERQNAKQICYGMVYGIGPRALGEQLGVCEEDAAQFMETFKSKYPTMRKFISTTVQRCRDNGCIVTLLGRKRFLPGIHSQNVHARSQAERQAVNSTIQGSAADLVKTAMVNIDRVLVEEFKTSPPCLTLTEPRSNTEQDKPDRVVKVVRGAYLVLQLHDELLYEVCERDLPRVAEIVQHQMENALELSVKFPVKVKTGASWGSLREYPSTLS